MKISNKKLAFVALAAAAVAATPALAQSMYKCVDREGKTSYQSNPCDGGQKSATIATTGGGSVPTDPVAVKNEAGKLRELQDQRRATELRDEISSAEANISTYRARMDRELAQLRKTKTLANNNLAGATWENSLSTEMQAVTANYDAKIRIEQSRIQQAQFELTRLGK